MKAIGVEALLAWAFCQELPKAPRASRGFYVPPAAFHPMWRSVSRMGELMTTVDEPAAVNAYGVVPDLTAANLPHPDALVVYAAVEELAWADFYLPDAYAPLSDLLVVNQAGHAGLRTGAPVVAGGRQPPGAAEAVVALLAAEAAALERGSFVDRSGRRRPRSEAAALIQKHAILGGCPDWTLDPLTLRWEAQPNGSARWFRRVRIPVMDAGGEPGPLRHEVEVDGYDHRRKRPTADAYRKPVLDPDPAAVALERIDYALWHAALDMLAFDLGEGRPAPLRHHSVLPFDRDPRPWDAGPEAARGRAPRVLPALGRRTPKSESLTGGQGRAAGGA